MILTTGRFSRITGRFFVNYQEGPATDSASVQLQRMGDITENTISSRPNPFKESTVITANIAVKTSNAYLVITDILGKEVTRYALQHGANEVVFSAADVNQQVLFCTLVIDGAKIKTNKIVLIK